MEYSSAFIKECLDAIDRGVSQAAVHKHYNVAKSTLRMWVKNPELYLGRETRAERDARLLGKKNPDVSTGVSPNRESRTEEINKSKSPNLHLTELAARVKGIRIAVIGDMQVKPGIDIGYCSRVGRYIADKRPDVIVNIGDFADMASCSFHDAPGSKASNAQNYRDDILATHLGMKALMTPIQEAMAQHNWKPRLVLTLGNHEHRINRTIEAIPKLDGTIGLPDLEYERWGWEVYPFMQQVTIEGVTFSHYFPSGQMGRPISSARALLNKGHVSCVAGHQQGRDIAFGKRMDGKQITAIICGSTYEHDEDYLNAQTNNHWRGFYILNNVRDGEFEEMAISLPYLRRRYGVASAPKG